MVGILGIWAGFSEFGRHFPNLVGIWWELSGICRNGQNFRNFVGMVVHIFVMFGVCLQWSNLSENGGNARELFGMVGFESECSNFCANPRTSVGMVGMVEK